MLQHPLLWAWYPWWVCLSRSVGMSEAVGVSWLPRVTFEVVYYLSVVVCWHGLRDKPKSST